MMTRQEASKIIEQYRMCSSGDCPTLECADCEYNHDPRKVEEAFLMAIDALESAQPEIKPIDYQDCANAMLRMWVDNVVTDGEYNRIMDKLNAFWRAEHEG